MTCEELLQYLESDDLGDPARDEQALAHCDACESCWSHLACFEARVKTSLEEALANPPADHPAVKRMLDGIEHRVLADLRERQKTEEPQRARVWGLIEGNCRSALVRWQRVVRVALPQPRLQLATAAVAIVVVLAVVVPVWLTDHAKEETLVSSTASSREAISFGHTNQALGETSRQEALARHAAVPREQPSSTSVAEGLTAYDPLPAGVALDAKPRGGKRSVLQKSDREAIASGSPAEVVIKRRVGAAPGTRGVPPQPAEPESYESYVVFDFDGTVRTGMDVARRAVAGGGPVQPTDGVLDTGDVLIASAGPLRVSRQFYMTSPYMTSPYMTSPGVIGQALDFSWPVDGRIISPFGRRQGGWHAGMDIKAEIGTPIRAAAAGVVISSGQERDYGRIIRVEHDSGFVTVYAHNLENLVKVGDRVSGGTIIATVGRTGRSTTPRLHFEVRRERIVYNPLHLLPAREVIEVRADEAPDLPMESARAHGEDNDVDE